jgi:hypothetical protein
MNLTIIETKSDKLFLIEFSDLRVARACTIASITCMYEWLNECCNQVNTLLT